MSVQRTPLKSPTIPPTQFETRLGAVRAILQTGRLDAALLHALPDIRYLTGFSGSNALLYVDRRRALFLTDARYTVQSSAEVRGAEIIIVQGPLFDALCREVRGSRRIVVGVQKESVTAGLFERMRDRAPQWRWKAIDAKVALLRARKDDAELALMRKAAGISDRVFASILRILAPGVRESELAAEITFRHRLEGADADAFEPIVASGDRGALPHARATEKRVRRGECVTLDFGCRVDGYHSDMTRTVAVGPPSRSMRSVYDAVLTAQLEAMASIHAGMMAREPDRRARKVLRSRGYERWFRHSLGHGLGLEVHEHPRLAPNSVDTLQEGAVVTVEPGVYIPNVGGVRIEDDIVVRPDGIELLTHSTKELLIV